MVVRAAGQEVRTPIWIVAVGDAVFIRSYRAEEGKWYRHVLAKRTFPLEIAGEDVIVRAEPVSEPATLEEISIAYRVKYPDAPEMPDMVKPPVVATSLELVLA